MERRPPSRSELDAARSRTIEDVTAPDLRVLFCGINPGLYSGATGHHFARPGNRFWPALHGSGFTPRLLHPSEQRELLLLGLGITNLVARTTPVAAELTKDELIEGGRRLSEKVAILRPAFLAILGVTAFRTAFQVPVATIGPQTMRLGSTRVWLLPNPSGLNAHYQLDALNVEFARLRDAVGTVLAN